MIQPYVPWASFSYMQQVPCRSVISVTSQSNCIEITLRHGRSPVKLLHILRAPFTTNTWNIKNYEFSTFCFFVFTFLSFSENLKFYDCFMTCGSPAEVKLYSLPLAAMTVHEFTRLNYTHAVIQCYY